jgi:hypothetical protein
MKKLIVSFMLVTLLLSIAGIGMVTASKSNNAPEETLGLPENAVEVSPGVFYLGKSMDKGQVVEGYAFVHYAKSAVGSKQVFDESVDLYQFMYGGIRWTDTMAYEVNPDESGLTGPEVLEALGASLETWDEAITGDFELFDNELLTTDKGFNSSDRINRITWDDLGTSGTIAMNSFWYNPALKVIVESDVQFNTAYTWSVDETCSDSYDLESIATHEFGHNGLNDLYMPPSIELTMHGHSYGYCETHARTLGTGDISGIQALYGE